MEYGKHLHAVGGFGRVQRGENTSSVGELTISTAALTVAGVGGLVVDGRVNLHAALTQHGYRAVRVEQARRYALEVGRGFNVRGHFAVIDSEDGACASTRAPEPRAAA